MTLKKSPESSSDNLSVNSSVKNKSKLVLAFRILGWIEGASFLLLLFVGMPLKYIGGNPAAVKALGMPHGLLFIAYVLFANYLAEDLEWSGKVRIYAFLAAVLPFGTFIFEKKYLKNH